jgi:hypothetical protein
MSMSGDRSAEIHTAPRKSPHENQHIDATSTNSASPVMELHDATEAA